MEKGSSLQEVKSQRETNQEKADMPPPKSGADKLAEAKNQREDKQIKTADPPPKSGADKLAEAKSQREEKQVKTADSPPKSGADKLAEAKSQRQAKAKPSAGDAQPPEQRLPEAKKGRESKQSTSDIPLLVDNQYFKVYFGATLIGFRKVSSINQAAEQETLAEGGVNDRAHVLTKPGRQNGTLTLEKAIADEDKLRKIMRLLKPGTRISVPVTITLCRREKEGWKNVRSWGFDDGMIVRWAVSDLDAVSGELAVETLEIAHAGLVEL